MSSAPSPSLRLSVVIPVHNEQETIGEVIDRICGLDLGPIQKELIVSDDGSTDATAQVLQEYRARYRDMITVHTSPINIGKGAAVRLGMTYATGDIVLILDSDLELDPSECVHLIEPMVAGQADVVYGSRFLGGAGKIPLRTRLANRFLTTLTNLLYGARLSDMETGYKAFRREVLGGLRLRCVRFDFEPEITAKLLRAGYRIHEVPVSYVPRTASEGKRICCADGIAAIYTLFRCRFLDP
jgi:glycosyltransferase involved in cell wall biosynthesis